MLKIKGKIILASASPRRAKLLKELGLKFIIYPVKIKEERQIKQGCAKLVKRNALRKAREVAKRFKRGIVIGADTVVLVKKRLIGKPRNYREAKKFLRLFSQYPHWVYTGLAIIDIERKKCYTAYDKTKIIFHKLSDEEIDKYLSRNLSLDRAGGIDIEGEAKKLVKEIRGDFYNVVGLPIDRFKELWSKLV
ncbi:MAG: Maf family protein [Candidatus Omnitrophica bacterium]|nr:Maf family protein [Candidatus Omnitrophota bacterium]MCM8798516.1 Maf family protein [Candidatus Omnitrophota bacterium]